MKIINAVVLWNFNIISLLFAFACARDKLRITCLCVAPDHCVRSCARIMKEVLHRASSDYVCSHEKRCAILLCQLGAFRVIWFLCTMTATECVQTILRFLRPQGAIKFLSQKRCLWRCHHSSGARSICFTDTAGLTLRNRGIISRSIFFHAFPPLYGVLWCEEEQDYLAKAFWELYDVNTLWL
jgi:hypothetical protein